jgi:hypothetical protein
VSLGGNRGVDMAAWRPAGSFPSSRCSRGSHKRYVSSRWREGGDSGWRAACGVAQWRRAEDGGESSLTIVATPPGRSGALAAPRGDSLLRLRQQTLRVLGRQWIFLTVPHAPSGDGRYGTHATITPRASSPTQSRRRGRPAKRSPSECALRAPRLPEQERPAAARAAAISGQASREARSLSPSFDSDPSSRYWTPVSCAGGMSPAQSRVMPASPLRRLLRWPCGRRASPVVRVGTSPRRDAAASSCARERAASSCRACVRHRSCVKVPFWEKGWGSPAAGIVLGGFPGGRLSP